MLTQPLQFAAYAMIISFFVVFAILFFVFVQSYREEEHAEPDKAVYPPHTPNREQEEAPMRETQPTRPVVRRPQRRLGRHYFPQSSDSNCFAALICLILAITLLSVVTFTVGPLTAAGISSTAVGGFCMLGCIFFFARYGHFLKRELGQQ